MIRLILFWGHRGVFVDSLASTFRYFGWTGISNPCGFFRAYYLAVITPVSKGRVARCVCNKMPNAGNDELDDLS